MGSEPAHEGRVTNHKIEHLVKAQLMDKKFVEQTKEFVEQTKEFVKQTKEFVEQTKEFLKQKECRLHQDLFDEPGKRMAGEHRHQTSSWRST